MSNGAWWDEHSVICQCLVRCYQKLFQEIRYLSPVMLSCSHVLKWSRTHGGPALSFLLGCNWIWVEVILSHNFWSADWRPHTWKALFFPIRCLWAVSLLPGSKWRRCAKLHVQMVRYIMFACVWTTTLPFRGQKSQSFCPNPWQIWIHLALNKLTV